MRKTSEIVIFAFALTLGWAPQVQAEQSPNKASSCPGGGMEIALPFAEDETVAPTASLSDLIEQYTTESIRRAIDGPPDPAQTMS